MSQQEMNYGEMERERPGFASGGYEGIPLSGSQEEGWGTPPRPHHGGYEGIPLSGLHGEKLSGHVGGWSATAGQRLALAIVSLGMFLFLTFGLVILAITSNAPPWVIAPILFILVLFAVVAVIINVVFNRKI